MSNTSFRAARTCAAIALVALGFLSAGVPSVAMADAPKQTLGDLVRAGKRDSVIAAITSPDVDVNEQAPDGSTALMWATFNVDRDLVRALLKAGAKADVVNRYGATALNEAVKVDDIELVRLLLDAGADVNSPNLDKQTALMTAVSNGSLPIAKLLVERGADVNAIETFRGQNALMWAAGGNHPEIVDLLLAHGAKNVDLRGKWDDWPRQMTSEPRAQFQSRQTGGLTALLYATRSGCLRCAESLVKAGADVDKPNPDGVTPLLNALDNKRWDIAMFLLDKGANPHTWDMSGRTPIYVAVDVKTFTGAGQFGGGAGNNQARGAFGAEDAQGQAAATKAVAPMDVINRLLAMKVDVNHELTRKRPYGAGRGRFADYDLRGGTGPLFVAAMRQDHESIEALLAHGAEVDLPNVFRMTPLMVAVGMSGTNRGGGPESNDQEKVVRTVDLLLAAGADINARVLDSRTHTAVLQSYIQGRDQEGRTALFAAAEGGRDKVVAHLLAKGADATVKDATGKTALDAAKAPAPTGPGGPGRGAPGPAERAATVKLLEARLGVAPSAPPAGAPPKETISAR